MPMVSIIVPVFNVERYLRKCLDSLLCQTYRNIEIICIDDGSTDGSPAIVDEYAARDSRVVAIHQKNQGLAAARNTGLNCLHGDWVTGVDSDDWLEPHTIEKALSVATEDVDIVWFGIRVLTDTGEGDNPYYHPKQLGKHVVTDKLIRNTNVNFCAKLWRVKLIEQHNSRFYPGLWYEDNYFFYTTAPWARAMYFLEDKMYCRYMRDDSIMGTTLTKSPIKALDQLITRGLILERFRQNGLPPVFGDQIPAPIEFFLVRNGYNFSKRYVPKKAYCKLKKEARRIIFQYGLTSHMLEFGHMMNFSPLKKLFIQYSPGQIEYKLFGIPFMKRKIKNKRVITRFLGIKVSCTPYEDPETPVCR